MMEEPWSMACCQALVPTEASVMGGSPPCRHQELQGLGLVLVRSMITE